MKVLFVNACMRGKKSRTLELCNDYLEKLSVAYPEAEIEEVALASMDIQVQDGAFIERRDAFLRTGDFSDEMFDLAKQFIAADHVIIGAPYWDLSFPAKVKIYLERCSVDKLTFIYDDYGVPHGRCRAKALTYITTAGGYIGDFNFGFDYVKCLCSTLFGIKEFHFAAADGIDIIGTDVAERLAQAKGKFTEILKEI